MGGTAAWAGWAMALPKFSLGGHNAFGPTNNWPQVCSLILQCCQLILRKISKTGASRYQILRLKCTKFAFCWDSALDSAPRLLPLFKGPTSKGMEGNGRGGRKGKGEGRGEVKEGIWPTQKFWCGAPYDLVTNVLFCQCQLECKPLLFQFIQHLSQRSPFWIRSNAQTLQLSANTQRHVIRRIFASQHALKLLLIALHYNLNKRFTHYFQAN